MKNYYKILGVTPDASAAEIKQAYRRLASQYHPDKGGDTQKFQEVEEAYRNLSDPAKRQEHDSPRFYGDDHIFDRDDLFSMFEALRRHQQQMQPISISLWIELQDIAQGGQKILAVKFNQATQNIEIDIPPGVVDGDKIRYTGIAPGHRDLIVLFRIKPNSQWQRSGDDLIIEHQISVWDLIVGGNITVTTILGQQISVTIPPRTQTGVMLRIRGHGLPSKNQNKGDMLIKLNAQIPEVIPDALIEQIHLAREQ